MQQLTLSKAVLIKKFKSDSNDWVKSGMRPILDKWPGVDTDRAITSPMASWKPEIYATKINHTLFSSLNPGFRLLFTLSLFTNTKIGLILPGLAPSRYHKLHFYLLQLNLPEILSIAEIPCTCMTDNFAAIVWLFNHCFVTVTRGHWKKTERCVKLFGCFKHVSGIPSLR